MPVEGVVNSFLGGAGMPGRWRYFGYRSVGMHVQTMAISGGLRVAGPYKNVTIGAETEIRSGCFLEAVAPITIGSGCLLGADVAMITSHHPWTAEGRISKMPQGRPITIGDRVRLGARCLILPGVSVADGVTVDAGSVVVHDCRLPGRYAGIPARRVAEID